MARWAVAETAARLERRRVRCDLSNEECALLYRVPTNPRFFSKAATNLLIKRARHGLPFLVCVDEDLQYVGRDAALAQTFAGAVTRSGWRVLAACAAADERPALLDSALRLLGFEETEPLLAWPLAPDAKPAARGPLERYGRDLCQGPVRPFAGRAAELAEALEILSLQGSRLLAIVGESGVGKSALAEVAGRRHSEVSGERAFSVDLGVLMGGALLDSDRESRLAALLNDAASTSAALLVLENVDLGLTGLTCAPYLLAAALDQGLRLVATLPGVRRRLLATPPLGRRVRPLELIEPLADETRLIVAAHRPTLELFHGVTLDAVTVGAAVELARGLAGCYPAKALALLDAACARARTDGARQVDVAHVADAADSLAALS